MTPLTNPASRPPRVGALADRLADRFPPRMIAGMLAVLVVATILGWWVAGQLRTDAPPADPATPHLATLGNLSVAIDPTWQRSEARTPAWAADLRDRVAFAPVPGTPVLVWLGRADSDHASLVPAALRAAVEPPLPRPSRTLPGGRAAWTYHALRLRGGGSLELTVAPATGGDLVIACTAPGAWTSVASGCNRGITAIGGGPGLAPAADLMARRRAPGIVAQLRRARRAGAQRLAAARTPAAQALAARSLALAHRDAARRLAAVAVPGTASQAGVAALRATADRWSRLGRAARQGRRAAYVRERGRLRKADARLRKAIGRLLQG
jgi:hypothetical protein